VFANFSPGLKLANAFGVKLDLKLNAFESAQSVDSFSVDGSGISGYYLYRVTGRIQSAGRAEPT
jgi:hypothetical protein